MGMKLELKLPRYGTNMEEATIARWLKQVGDTFEKGEPLCELETEKVTTAFEAPVAGRLLEVMGSEGDEILVGQILCRIEAA